MLPIDHRTKQKLLLWLISTLSTLPTILSWYHAISSTSSSSRLLGFSCCCSCSNMSISFPPRNSCSVPSTGNILPVASQCLVHLIMKVLAQLSASQRFPWPLTYIGANFEVHFSSSQASLKINLFYILWSFHYHFNFIFTVSTLLVHENRDLIWLFAVEYFYHT